MKQFDISEVQQAQEWRPQIERFILSDRIIVIEYDVDYRAAPDDVQAVIDLRNLF